MPAFEVHDHLGWNAQGAGPLVARPADRQRPHRRRRRAAAAHRHSRGGQPLRHRRAADRAAEHPAVGHPRRRSRGGRGRARRARRGHGRADQRLAAQQPGVPGAADLRPGHQRGRARAAAGDGRHRSGARRGRPAGPADRVPHDRLPERLRAAVRRRGRAGRPLARQVPALSRRRRRRHAAGAAVPRSGAARHRGRHAEAAVRGLPRRPARRRRVRRLLRSARVRRAEGRWWRRPRRRRRSRSRKRCSTRSTSTCTGAPASWSAAGRSPPARCAGSSRRARW